MPRCDLKPGYKQWKKHKNNMLKNVGALAEAVHKLPKCGEEGASEVFCVNEPTGRALVCEYVGYLLVVVVGTFNSIRAIETKGGDDDRQWLTFWIIFFLFSIIERLSSVLLSRVPIYYELKLCVIIWLFPPFYGARWLYVSVHTLFRKTRRRRLVQLFFKRALGLLFQDLNDYQISLYLGETDRPSAIKVQQAVHAGHKDKASAFKLQAKVFAKLEGDLDALLAKGKLAGKDLRAAARKKGDIGRLYSHVSGESYSMSQLLNPYQLYPHLSLVPRTNKD